MSTPLLENILHQPAALHGVADHHLRAGREALLQAASTLTSARRVVVTGMGASFFACVPFVYQLSARGVSVITAEASELLHFLQDQLDAHTVVLLVSRSGESVEVAKLLPEIRKRGASVVGLTNVAGSTLDREADLALSMASPSDQLVAIQTYAATVATLALLDAAIDGKLDAAAGELGATAEAFSRWIPACVGARESWSEFLGGPQPLYLLGRGPTVGSVAEGALLLHETAKAPAVGMSVAQFRHGPVEVVDPNFRAIIWGTQPTTVTLEAALADDLTRMGAQVRWIGPDHGAPALCEWPAVPTRFVHLAEIVPLQIAAYRKAELAGIRPGDFRWAAAITASESGFSIAR